MSDYTGRDIAVFTDIHGLLEPTLAVLKDIKKRGITEIYSLGDAIGVGPNPSEVLDALSENDVKQVNGNSEEYVVLGIAPFKAYFNQKKIDSQKWTLSKLRDDQIRDLEKNKHSIDLNVGNKELGLCHFANDVRFDLSNNTWTYQKAILSGKTNPNEQFLVTNEPRQKSNISLLAAVGTPSNKGFASAVDDPLFKGKTVTNYDEIFQGHVHFKSYIQDKFAKVFTLRAMAMAYANNDDTSLAYYIIIHEKENGYDIEEIYVPYSREKLYKSIDESTIPDRGRVNRYILRK